MQRLLYTSALLASSLLTQLTFAQQAPVTLTASDTDPLGSVDQLSRFVGQRVRIASLHLVGPSENGMFYGVISGLNRPFRKPGLRVDAVLPDGFCCVPRFPGSPELLRVDASAYGLDVAAGTTLTEVTGLLQHADGAYTVTLDAAPAVGESPALAVPRTPVDLEFTVSSLETSGRIERDAAAVQSRLRNPDVLTVADHADALADVLNQALGEGTYQAYGAGLLVRTGRVTVQDLATVDGFTVARLSVLRPATDASTITLLVARLPQMDADLDGQAARRDRAEALARLVQDRQDRGERVLVAGDFQSYQFSDGYVDVMGTLTGRPMASGQVVYDSPALLANPLTNLLESLPLNDQYSAVVKGEAAALDHILVSDPMRSAVTGFAMVRGNADAPASSRLAGRDNPMGYISGLSVSNLTDLTTQIGLTSKVILSPGTTTLTITAANFSRMPVHGPFYLLLTGLPAGVTITNSVATVLGNPVVALSGTVTSLGPGQSASVLIQSQNPTRTPLTVSAKIVGGTL